MIRAIGHTVQNGGKYDAVENYYVYILNHIYFTYIIVHGLKPYSREWCTLPIFGTGGYFPCHRIGIHRQLLVTGAAPEGCR